MNITPSQALSLAIAAYVENPDDTTWVCLQVAHENSMRSLGSSGGVELTDELIQHLSDQAEHGYTLHQMASAQELSDDHTSG